MDLEDWHHIGDSWKFYSDNWGPWTNFTSLQREQFYIKNAPYPYMVVLDRATTSLKTNLRFNLPMPYTAFPHQRGKRHRERQ